MTAPSPADLWALTINATTTVTTATTTQLTVGSVSGFAPGQNILISLTDYRLIQSILGLVITLATPLSAAPSPGASVSNFSEQITGSKLNQTVAICNYLLSGSTGATTNSSSGTLSDINTTDTDFIRFTAASTINSFAGPTAGRVITIVNANSTAITIANDSGGTSANRILTGTGADFSMNPATSFELKYDDISSRWRLEEAPATGTETRPGILELATNAETVAGTDTERAVTPAGLAAASGGSNRSLVTYNQTQMVIGLQNNYSAPLTPSASSLYEPVLLIWDAGFTPVTSQSNLGFGVGISQFLEKKEIRAATGNSSSASSGVSVAAGSVNKITSPGTVLSVTFDTPLVTFSPTVTDQKYSSRLLTLAALTGGTSNYATGSSFSTSSSGYVDVTGSSVSITVSNNSKILAIASFTHTTGTDTPIVAITDSSNNVLLATSGTSRSDFPTTIADISSSKSAGSYTYKLRVDKNGGSSIAIGGTWTLFLIEIPSGVLSYTTSSLSSPTGSYATAAAYTGLSYAGNKRFFVHSSFYSRSSAAADAVICKLAKYDGTETDISPEKWNYGGYTAYAEEMSFNFLTDKLSGISELRLKMKTTGSPTWGGGNRFIVVEIP